MPTDCRDCPKTGVRFIYNHNPFYVISALLVLYGLHMSFAGSLKPTHGWLFTYFFMGYMLLLAATAVMVVRLGQVWEDSRTLVLLVALLMVALASSFDRVSLDNEYQGAKFLASGLAFSLLLSELLLRLLRLRFPWSYRLPFYLLLSLLFAYPPWLGHLSLENRLAEMAWFVMGFPTIAAVIFTLLAPAARRRGQDVTDNGTPWGWPLYPWSLFVLVSVGILLRAYAISMSFDPTKAIASGFQLYFLIPLLLSWILLWVEGADHAKPGRPTVAVAAPLALFALAFPGPSASVSEERYLSLLRDAVSSPIQITAALLLVYFAYIWLRGIRLAEIGVLIALTAFAFTNNNTVDLDTLTFPSLPPLVAAVTLLTLSSLWNRSTTRMAIAALVTIAGLSYIWRDSAFVAMRGYLPIHLAFFSLMLLGLMFHDWLGRAIARVAAIVLAATAIFVLIAYRILFPEVSAATHAALVFTLAVTAAAYWIKNRRFADLAAAAICLTICGVLAAEYIIGSSLTYVVLRGKYWLIWGLVAFLIGLAVSLIKAGQIRRLRRFLMRIHLTIHGSLPKS